MGLRFWWLNGRFVLSCLIVLVSCVCYIVSWLHARWCDSGLRCLGFVVWVCLCVALTCGFLLFVSGFFGWFYIVVWFPCSVLIVLLCFNGWL